jgi:hypothetical protein
MLISEVAALFKVYMDEPDQTFVDNALMANWLQRAYDDFRCIVTEVDPYIYTVSQTYNLSAARKLDLDGTILGSAADPRMYQLNNIYEIESTALPDNILRRLDPSAALDSTYDLRANYTLKGTELFFAGEVTMAIRVDFIPEPTVAQVAAWNALGATYIDDLNRFHDLIALIAYLQYAISDSADNQQLIGLLGRRQQQLRTYLENRSGGIVERVVDVRWM